MPDPAPVATPGLGPDGFPVSGAATPPPALKPAATPPSPPSARFLVDRPRSKTRDLSWPVEVGGVEYRQIVVRRLTTGEIGAFVDRVRSTSDGADVRFPLFYDVDGNPVGDDVWNALDPDDSDALVEDGNDFLPARFRTARTQPASIPSDADITGNTSDASPASA